VQESTSIRSELWVYSRTPDTVDKITAVVTQPKIPFLGSALRFFRIWSLKHVMKALSPLGSRLADHHAAYGSIG
jgi:hypothetical protein